LRARNPGSPVINMEKSTFHQIKLLNTFIPTAELAFQNSGSKAAIITANRPKEPRTKNSAITIQVGFVEREERDLKDGIFFIRHSPRDNQSRFPTEIVR
jgi:hypothetical protein